MIRKFDSTPLKGAGYLGSILRDHQDEERERYYDEKKQRVGRVGTHVMEKFPYFWARCDWCGEIAILDDEGEEQPHLKFEKLLNWASSLTPETWEQRHFCSRKCRAAFIDRYGEG